MIREITARDVEMFFLLEALKERSACIDKQVACIIGNARGDILATGVNTVIECDKNCHDKEHRVCEADHAERVALRNLPLSDMERELEGCWDGTRGRTAYVSLFPCTACQKAILPYVDEIVTFGMIHKDWVSGDKLTVFPHLSYTLLKHNGNETQRSIAAGELAELITAISDVFSRDDKNARVRDLLDEIYDVELQLNLLKIMAHAREPEAFNALRAIRAEKTLRLLRKYGKSGLISYTV